MSYVVHSVYRCTDFFSFRQLSIADFLGRGPGNKCGLSGSRYAEPHPLYTVLLIVRYCFESTDSRCEKC